MCAHRIPVSPGAVPPSDRAGESSATPSGGSAQRRAIGRNTVGPTQRAATGRAIGFRSRLRPLFALPLKPTAFKPLTYSAMHLCVAIAVAYALTRDWRIALGVGVIEPMVQTIAYMAHEKAWSLGRAKTQA